MNVVTIISGQREVPPTTKAHLLAVRRAGAPFTTPFRMFSQTFEALLKERNLLLSRIGLVQSALVEDIFNVVPQATSPRERHALLAVKRAVHNARPVNADDLAVIHGELARRVSHYNTLATALAGLISRNQQSVVLELRSCIHELAAIPYFANAVNYSCPWLLNVLKAKQSEDSREFTDAERGTAAYAIKFFSKANPLHIFASLWFGSDLKFEPMGECEVVINPDLILKLEQECLRDPSPRLLSLRPYFDDGKTIHFFIAHSAIVTIKKSSVLSAIMVHWTQEHSECSFGSCKLYLQKQFPALDDSAAEQYIRKLIGLGIIDEYMVRDFDDLAAELSNVSSKYESTIRVLHRLHLTTVARSDLTSIHEQMCELVLPSSMTNQNTYHINSYHSEMLLPGDAFISRVMHDLRDLKPLFLRCSNFGGRTRVLRSYLAHRLSTEPAGRLPYLKLLWEFMNDAARIIERHELAAKTLEMQAWRAHLSLESGELSCKRLEQLMAASPVALQIGQEDKSSICFNGPLDAIEGLYYLVNSLAGDGRFVSRYLIGPYRNRYPLGNDTKDESHVQLIPSCNSRSYTSNLYRIGCSFDGRWQHRFEDWINPSDIEIALTENGIGYFQISTGRRLHFCLAGFQLAESLGLEYQLLLADSHADYFGNPFDRDPMLCPLGQYKTNRIPPLYYRNVCLRRQRWVFPASEFKQIWCENDIVSTTLSLLDFIGAATKLQSNDWYFRVHRKGQVAEQPRYLDLHNPLNVQIFRRACTTKNGADLISLSPMEPRRENLLRDEQGPWSTELMIEV